MCLYLFCFGLYLTALCINVEPQLSQKPRSRYVEDRRYFISPLVLPTTSERHLDQVRSLRCEAGVDRAREQVHRIDALGVDAE